MPPEVMAVSESFMRDPVRILVKQEELTLEGIRQFYVQVEREVRLKFESTHYHIMLTTTSYSRDMALLCLWKLNYPH